jgi:hypothetical protein
MIDVLLKGIEIVYWIGIISGIIIYYLWMPILIFIGLGYIGKKLSKKVVKLFVKKKKTKKTKRESKHQKPKD